MTSSREIVDYLGAGLLAERPTPPPVDATALAVYLAVDTGDIAAWFVDHWATIANLGGGGPTPTTGGFLLEDGSGVLLLEDGTSLLLLESA